MMNDPEPIDGNAWRGVRIAIIPSLALWWLILAYVPGMIIAGAIGAMIGVALELATRKAG